MEAKKEIEERIVVTFSLEEANIIAGILFTQLRLSEYALIDELYDILMEENDND